MPVDPEKASTCQELIDQGKSLHVSVRHVTFHWTLGRLGKTDRKTELLVERLEPGSSKEDLANFYADFNKTGVEQATFIEHLHALEKGYGAQNTLLETDGRNYLNGDQFSTADIIWAVKVLRLTECGYPFAHHFPALASWYGRIKQRRGFPGRRAVTQPPLPSRVPAQIGMGPVGRQGHREAHCGPRARHGERLKTGTLPRYSPAETPREPACAHVGAALNFSSDNFSSGLDSRVDGIRAL